MKKQYLIKIMLVISLMISGVSRAQSISDQVEVLKLCINLPEIQDKEAINKETNDDIYIMQHSVWFNPENFNDNLNQNLIFMEKDDIYSQNINSFFRFEKMDLAKNSGKIIYEFHKNQKSKDLSAVYFIIAGIKKVNSKWVISELNIEGR